MPYVLGNVAGLALVLAVGVGGARWLSTGQPPRVLRPLVGRAQTWLDDRRPVPKPLPPVSGSAARRSASTWSREAASARTASG